jgi:glycosyltransferase involved in cell wall biosynthesis
MNAPSSTTSPMTPPLGHASECPSLSVVVPFYNEEDSVGPLVARVHEALASYGGHWELICVDDGSRDQTGRRLLMLRDQYGPHVRVQRFRRNHGQTAAMQAGIDLARGEVIATMDGDLQNDPADLPRMVAELQARDLDLLAGRRANRQDDWLSRKFPSMLANRMIARVTGVQLRDYGCSLKVYRAAMIREIRLFGEMHRLIPVWAATVTSPARIGEIDVLHHARAYGQSKYGISRTFRVLLDLLTAFFFLRFQRRPGHFFGGIGLALGGLGSLMLLWLAFVKFALGENIGGRPMLLAAIFLLVFATQFICTGVLAELVTRLFRHSETAVSLPDPEPREPGWYAARRES